MGFSMLTVISLCFVFMFGILENKACIEVERLALVEFKKYLNSEGYDADYVLPFWDDDPRSKCCEWERVSCNRTTGHVTELSLDNIRQRSDDDYDDYQATTWLFNISMLQNFDELLLLNLSFNSIRNWNHKKGSENVLRLKKLETLDLSWNYLKESIIPSLRGLSSLKNLNLGQNSDIYHFPLKDLLSFEQLETLNLQFCGLNTFAEGEEGVAHSTKRSKLKHLDVSGNDLTENLFSSLGKLLSLEYLDLSFSSYGGPFSINDISGLSNLRVLLMGYNDITETLSIQNQTALSQLQILDLSNNDINSISSEFGALTSLKVLDLSYNRRLNDSAIAVLCGLKMLEELYLSYADLTVIPRCLHNLTSIKVLDLYDSGISGQVPSSWFAALTSLEYIDIRRNYFHGLFLFSSFNNHSRLERVFLGSQDESFMVETEDEDWMPKFQLKNLVLSKCKLNLFSHKTPSFLPQQHDLRVIDLSDNNLGGRFPDWLVANNSRMIVFDLSNNSFTGDFNMSLYPMIDLITIDVSKNQIKGILPRKIGNIFPNLGQLQLSSNAFGGSLPSSVGLMRNMEVLDLSSNNFHGEVPETLFQCTILSVLRLSNNEFTGNFFATHYNLSSLTILQLNNNMFTGSMSNVTSNYLEVLDVSFNFMSGRVPAWINRTGVSILNLRHNSLKGEVSCDVFDAYNFVDFSQNSLSGTLPSCSNMEFITQLHLQSNNFTGSIPEILFNSSSLLLLNLRDNRLSNSIPDKIGNSSSLRALLLGVNQLNGLIPKNICLLEKIRLMDLSYNYLSGSIPPCLANLSLGKTYDQSECIYYDSCGFVESNKYFRRYFTYRNNWGSYDKHAASDRSENRKVFNQIDFMTKNGLNTYKGDILNFMSGLDLSCNYLVGKIPSGLGNFTQLHAMNLSHNLLTGPIPNTFASLAQVESLDLSHNRLSGEIPSQLTQLTFLGVFSVAYYNLSGRIPYGTGQFSTFERSSYEGNAYLCGKPLDRNCSGDDGSALPSPRLLPDNGGGHLYDVDKVMFFASFSASFAVFFSGVVAFLYVNPYWRQCVFYYGEKFVLSCYYFVSDAVFMLSLRFRRG